MMADFDPLMRLRLEDGRAASLAEWKGSYDCPRLPDRFVRCDKGEMRFLFQLDFAVRHFHSRSQPPAAHRDKQNAITIKENVMANQWQPLVSQ